MPKGFVPRPKVQRLLDATEEEVLQHCLDMAMRSHKRRSIDRTSKGQTQRIQLLHGALSSRIYRILTSRRRRKQQ